MWPTEGLATSWHHFTWPPPQHPATQNPRASTEVSGTQNGTVPQGAQSVRTLDRHVFLSYVRKNVFHEICKEITCLRLFALLGVVEGAT